MVLSSIGRCANAVRHTLVKDEQKFSDIQIGGPVCGPLMMKVELYCNCKPAVHRRLCSHPGCTYTGSVLHDAENKKVD